MGALARPPVSDPEEPSLFTRLGVAPSGGELDWVFSEGVEVLGSLGLS